MMKLKVIQFISLILLSLVVGVFWGTWFSLSRSIDVFSAEEFIHIGKTIIQNLAMPMRIIMPACILFMALELWFHSPKRSTGFYLSLTAFVLIIIALLITLLIEVPIDNQVKEWTAATIPSDWEETRDHWEFFHTVRTFVSIISLGCFLGAIMSTNKAM